MSLVLEGVLVEHNHAHYQSLIRLEWLCPEALLQILPLDTARFILIYSLIQVVIVVTYVKARQLSWLIYAAT